MCASESLAERPGRWSAAAGARKGHSPMITDAKSATSAIPALRRGGTLRRIPGGWTLPPLLLALLRPTGTAGVVLAIGRAPHIKGIRSKPASPFV